MSEDARMNKIEVFVSFANGDKKSYRMREVWKHLTDCLAALRAEGVIQDWFCRAIDDGQTDAVAIERLKRSDIVIFALGQNYLDHPERYREILKNLPESGRYLVFSLLLYQSLWRDSPFARFNLLPSNKEPVVEWGNVEDAFIEIKEAIKQARQAIYPDKPKPRLVKKDQALPAQAPEIFEDPYPTGASPDIDFSLPSSEPPEPFDIFEDTVEEDRPVIILPLPSVEAQPAPIAPSPSPAPSRPAPPASLPERQEPRWERILESRQPEETKAPKAPKAPKVNDSSSILSSQELEFERNRIVTDAARGADLKPDSEARKDIVDCTVFAPPSAPRNSTIFVQVYAHLQEQAEEVIRMAGEFDSDAKRRAVKSLEEAVARGTKLSFELTMPGLRGADPVQSIVWRGKPDAAQFAVDVPGNCPLGAIVGSVTISAHSIPIGHIKFKLQITELGSEAPVNEAVGEEAKRYKQAFISYASADRSKVLARVQMLDLVGIRYFQDVLSLGPGDRWEKEIYRNIDSCDLFLLFWSKAARDSEWVLKEVRYAKERRPSPEIKPVILEGPPVIMPPEDLNDLHFNDRFVYFILD